jgi:hypothetical protein
VTLADGGGNIIAWNNIVIPDNGLFAGAWTISSPSGSSNTYRMVVTPTSNGQVSDSKLVAVTGRR